LLSLELDGEIAAVTRSLQHGAPYQVDGPTHDAGFFATAAAEESAFATSADEARRVSTLGDLALQRELAALSTRGELRVLPDAGHLLPLEHPDAMSAAVAAALALRSESQPR
jgi:hypothetical protein